MNPLSAVKPEQLERALGALRVLSGVLALLVTPFLSITETGPVFVFALLLITYGLVTIRLDRWAGGQPARMSRALATTAGDAVFALIALFLCSADAAWVMAPLILPIILISGLRLGPRGAFGAALVTTVGYLSVAAFRYLSFGHPINWAQLVLLIVLSLLTALLVSTILIGAEAVRAAGRDLYEPLLAAQDRLGQLTVVTEGGYAVYVSAGVPDITGLTVRQLKSAPLAELLPQLAAESRDRDGREVGSVRQYATELRGTGGEIAHVEIGVTDLPSVGGVPRTLILGRDVTEQVRAQAELEHAAIHDMLTGLPNRALVGDRLDRELARMNGSDRLSVLYFDLDRFKDLNDSIGHAGGDAVLIEAAARLQRVMTAQDSISRYEADEFVVVLSGDGDQVAERAAAFLDVLAAPFEVAGQAVHLTATVGVATAPEHGRDAATLIRSAEAAMSGSKRASRAVGVYSPADDRHGAQRLELLNDLRGAIDRGELWLAFQPIVVMATGEPASVEALLRWNHPVRGAIPPMEFIPLAEESGLIRRLGLWVLDQAIQTCASWHRGGPGVSVNMSIRNLRMPEFKDAISSTLEIWQLPKGALTLEITENVIMDDPSHIIQLLQELQDAGVRGSIDDYGTGYSSLAYLLRLPVREMKIDRAFIADMVTNSQSEKIVRSTINLAHDLGLLVVAEGIEDQQTWDALAALGCDLAQGYFVARPMPAAAVRTWLRERRDRVALPVFESR